MTKQSFFFKFTTILLSFFLGLFVAEVSLRILNIPHFYKARLPASQFDFVMHDKTKHFFYLNSISKTIVFKYDSNPRGYFSKDNTVEHYTNADGFRGPEFKREKPPHTIRILFLGDSFVFGEGVRFEDTLAEATKKILSEKFPRQNINFEMYNLGVGGYNTADELFVLKNAGLKLNPDYIVVVYNLNDAEPPLFDLSPEKIPLRKPREANIPEGIANHPPPEMGLFNFRLVQLLWKVLTLRMQEEQTEGYYQSLYQEDKEDWKNTQDALKQIALTTKEKNIPTLLALYPLLYHLDGTHPFLNLYAKVEKTVKETGMEFLDLFPAFKGKKNQDLWVYPTDQHPNEVANRIAAEKLAERLLSDKEFKEKIRRIAEENGAPL